MPRTDLVTPTYLEAILASRPASYWRMGEASGSVLDLVGGVTGTVNGTIGRNAASVIAMDFEGSADFDGSTGYVTLSDVYDFEGTAPFSVAAWVVPDTLGASLRIVDKDTGAAGWNFSLSNGATALIRRAGGADSATTVGVVAAGQTAMVVATYDGTVMRAYLNGTGGVPTPSTRSLAGIANVLTFGRRTSVASNFFDGRIDEVTIWNRAIAHSEILRLYEIGRG